jgi:hypothetical protein
MFGAMGITELVLILFIILIIYGTASLPRWGNYLGELLKGRVNPPLGGHKGGDKMDATRYLCAAAHLDMVFRRQVIEQVMEEEHKAIGPSYGIDLVRVVKHCLASKRRKTVRNIILAALFICLVLVLSSLDERRDDYTLR